MKREDVNYDDLSPMMKQYIDIKKKHENELLFFRLGDFYELFFEDGILASRELELTLTGKNAGLKERVPMCGVPFHSVKPYIEKLIEKGYKVAICEQLEDPKSTKGMVKRDVINVISKGSFVDLEFLNSFENNYIGSILDFNYSYVLTYADISTGKIYSIMLPHIEEKVINEVLTLGIKEIILADSNDSFLIDLLKNKYSINLTISGEYLENNQKIYNNVSDIKIKTGIKHLFYYLSVSLMKDLSHMDDVVIIDKNEFLELDVHTVRNLELIETIRNKERNNSLIWLIDKTKTAMGSRLLKDWMLKPLRNKENIESRYEKIEKLNNEFLIRENIRNNLNEMYDLERLCGKVVCGNFNPRDLLQIKNSLKVLPNLIDLLKNLKFDYKLHDEEYLRNLITNAISEEAPITLKDGGIFLPGYNYSLDELKEIRSGGKNYIAAIEEKAKNDTGIKTLKVGYNKIFGYYIEISKGQIKNVNDSLGWERKQTLADKERYISPELKEKEDLILNAEEKIINLEYDLFNELKEKVKERIPALKLIAEIVSEVDVICNLSVISEELNLVKPEISTKQSINIIEGRHPVVERLSKNEYVPNDILMNEDTTTLLITGPNMSGKSTYMRQIAVIIILAQMGSFVPAKKAIIPIFDKIFTRIGASDDLVSGESTFMVEMKEAENAISNATSNSLILFDELGRGTATYDGMSLAQAILEYVNEKIKCKTLFSTHYHELISLGNKYTGIKNIHVSALEEDGNIVFLHKIKDGAVDKSYGIHVAALAKIPNDIIKRASDILKYYECNSNKQEIKTEQLLFDFKEEKEDSIRKRLKEIDPLKTTPLEAINLLYELKELDK